MTRTNLLSKLQFLTLAVIANLIMVFTNAQEKAPDLDVDVDLNKGTDMGADWMSNPLVWVVGALVLIIIIALVARGNGNRQA